MLSFLTTLSNYRQRCQFKKKAKHQTRTQKKAICLCCKNERAWCYTARRQFNKNRSTTPRTHNKTHANSWLLWQTYKKRLAQTGITKSVFQKVAVSTKIGDFAQNIKNETSLKLKRTFRILEQIFHKDIDGPHCRVYREIV